MMCAHFMKPSPTQRSTVSASIDMIGLDVEKQLLEVCLASENRGSLALPTACRKSLQKPCKALSHVKYSETALQHILKRKTHTRCQSAFRLFVVWQINHRRSNRRVLQAPLEDTNGSCMSLSAHAGA